MPINGRTPNGSSPERSVLSVRELNVSFASRGFWLPVVRNVSFEIEPGETVAIVGESGSGKSVTSLAVMRLHDERSTRLAGAVELDGRDLLRLDQRAMRRVRGNEIAMIFQEPMTSLNPIETVGNQIAEAMVAHRSVSSGEVRRETLALLDKVRIPNAKGRFDEYPHQFSGGMRQRVMIAMALASRPRLLIADEPTTALDVTVQGQILDLIRALQREDGTSVLFVTHDMGVVAEIADRTIVMNRGEIVEQGPTPDVFRAPRRPYTKSLLSAVPRLGSMSGRADPAPFPVVDSATGEAAPDHPVATGRGDGGTVLSVNNLVARFDIRKGILARTVGVVHAVENVSFDLRRGQTLALVGESGCGKSTTGRAILRLLTPRSGSVMVDGVDILSLDKQALRRVRGAIQMVFQDPYASLNPRMRIEETMTEAFVGHGRGSRADARSKAADLLKRVGLAPEMLSRFPHEFSGGQRQRISIARALMLDPKVVVADEAVSALDVSVKAQVCNLLLELQADLGFGLLFISHDMAVVERVSHRVAVMRLGEIVEIGPRAAVFERPGHEYTRRLMAAVPIPDPARRRERRAAEAEELRNPIRPPGYVPPTRTYAEPSPGHLVMA